MHLFASATTRADIRCAWRGPSMLVVQLDGSAGAHPLTGWYFRQARYLKDLRLRVRGKGPHPCSIAEVAPNELELTYIHPEVEKGGGGGSGSGAGGEKDGLLFRDLDLHLRYVVHPASLEILLRIANHWQDGVTLELEWLLSADYAAMDEAQFNVREQEAPIEAKPFEGGLDFAYRHPGLPLRTEVRAAGADWEFHADRLTTSVTLRRQEGAELALTVRAVDESDPIDADGEASRETKLQRWYAQTAELHAPGETPLVGIANRAGVDIGSFALMEGPPEEWLTPGAGVPLYMALWGRDALTASWQAGILDRGAMLEDVLAGLDRRQGTRVDPNRDEEPGRIINQVKRDPITRVSDNGFDRFYADVASPFLFIIGLGYHYALTGDLGHVRRRWDAAQRVLEWAERYGDRDGDGYIEYLTRAPGGPSHQGWKDSENAIVDEHGEQVAPPIAPCEIQGYWHVALQFMSVMAAALGKSGRALELWQKAAALKERFNRDFWMEDESYVAFGLDAEKRPIRALTSNPGQCLPTGIVDSEHIPRLVRRMFEPDLFSGWGIRTLSTRNRAYHPLDYHLGSVWPVENATIVFGLRRYGFTDRTHELVRGLYDLARLWPDGRTPECVGGHARSEVAHPGCYPRANRPQLWNQSIWPILVQSLLGIVPYAPARLLMVDPALPEWLPELTLKRLRVGDATVTLRFHREMDGSSHYEVVEREGKLRVVRQPWLESAAANTWDRISGLMESAKVAVSGRI